MSSSNPPDSTPTISPSLPPRDETSNSQSQEDLDSLRAEYSQLGVSPRLPNIPLRGLASPTSLPSTSTPLPDPENEDLTLGSSATSPQQNLRPTLAGRTASGSQNSSNRVSMTDSELGQAVQDEQMDLDTLPISDEQKARIIARQLVSQIASTIHQSYHSNSPAPPDPDPSLTFNSSTISSV